MKWDNTIDGDPYGVPTGSVPRVASPREFMGYIREVGPRTAAPDPIAQAVDDYLLMERKARAWDALLRVTNDPILLATMNAMVHPAQEPSTR